VSAHPTYQVTGLRVTESAGGWRMDHRAGLFGSRGRARDGVRASWAQGAGSRDDVVGAAGGCRVSPVGVIRSPRSLSATWGIRLSGRQCIARPWCHQSSGGSRDRPAALARHRWRPGDPRSPLAPAQSTVSHLATPAPRAAATFCTPATDPASMQSCRLPGARPLRLQSPRGGGEPRPRSL
jgi:hypothetical protein